MGPFAFSIPGNGQRGAGRLKSWAEHPSLDIRESIPASEAHHLEQARGSEVISIIDKQATPGAAKTSALPVVTLQAFASFAPAAKTGGTIRDRVGPPPITSSSLTTAKCLVDVVHTLAELTRAPARYISFPGHRMLRLHPLFLESLLAVRSLK
jgi:hypothetical protein